VSHDELSDLWWLHEDYRIALGHPTEEEVDEFYEEADRRFLS
jgi:hypothetical protein